MRILANIESNFITIYVLYTVSKPDNLNFLIELQIKNNIENNFVEKKIIRGKEI